MLKKLLGIAGLFALVILTSCSDYKKTESGQRYRIITDSTGGTPAEIGGVIFFNIQVSASGGKEDTLLSPSRPQMAKLAKKGLLQDGFMLLSVGDSAEFLVNIDTFFTIDGKMQPKEPWMASYNDLKFTVKVTKIMSAKEVSELQKLSEEQEKAEMEQRKLIQAELKKGLLAADSNKAQLKKDDAIIKEYLAKNKIKAERSSSGIYYSITTKGSGVVHAPGDTVSVHYTGKLLDGTVFDSSIPRKQPIEFIAGVGQVIIGWDEAVTTLHVGDKATIFIPSLFAYGAKGSPPQIPANSVLMFEVEIVK